MRTDNRAGFPRQVHVDYQRLLLDHLDLIDQIVRTTGRRRHLSATEREDFASFVNLRLVDDDYAILRKFQSRSTLWTYLAAVIERMSLDFCADKWGRWRPSAMAERIGPVAVLLERLVTRDSHTIEEAMEIVRTNHDVGMTYAELRGIWEQLPVRVRTTEVGEEAAAAVSSNDTSETTVEDADRRKSIERLQRALTDGVRSDRDARSRPHRASLRPGPVDGRDRQADRQFGADSAPAAGEEREATAGCAHRARASIRERSPT